jgi:hypothetical protein
VEAAVRGSDLLFGRGEDGYPFWLLTVRLDVLVFVLCAITILAWWLRPARLRSADRVDLGIALGLTGLAALLRWAVEHNLSDFGGIGYSRILFGYRGHFGAAQLYSLVYARSARDLEHAIALQRLASTLTVPLVYALCRRLLPATRSFATITATMIALHPLHVLFSATDALPISTSFVAAAAYLLLAQAIEDDRAPMWAQRTAAVGAAAGLTLLTQIRLENAVFLVPPAAYLWARRGALSRPLVWGGAGFLAFGLVYALEALSTGSSYQHTVPIMEGLQAGLREVAANPIFAMAPLLIGTAVTLLHHRSRARAIALLPLLAVFPLMALAGPEAQSLARTYVNELLLLELVAGYGLALLWDARRWWWRMPVVACLAWAAALPILFWPNLRERQLETVEHDFFGAALRSLPPGIDRVVVPDDEVLNRETHSTMEWDTKYRMIAAAVGMPSTELVGMTHFLEHPADVDCSRDNCVFFRGVPCMGLARYWFAAPGCAQVMAAHVGAPVREEEVVAGSYVDCSVDRGELRRKRCDPVRVAQRFGIYRITR